MNLLIKSIIFKLLPNIFKFAPKSVFIRNIEQKLRMSKLMRDDIVSWRVEKAREMGAKVGDNCKFFSLNIYSEPYLVEIGNDVIVSGNVIFITHDGSVYLFNDKLPNVFGNFGRIKIGNNCFIGMGTIILPNVEIGNNCIVGAGSVVMDSFPDNSVIFGNPAKVAFKTSMYEKLKLNNKMTLTHEDYFYPRQEDIPEQMKRDILEEIIAPIPIRRSRVRDNN